MADAVSGTGVHVRGACEAPYPPNNLLASASALRGAPSKAPFSNADGGQLAAAAALGFVNFGGAAYLGSLLSAIPPAAQVDGMYKPGPEHVHVHEHEHVPGSEVLHGGGSIAPS